MWQYLSTIAKAAWHSNIQVQEQPSVSNTRVKEKLDTDAMIIVELSETSLSHQFMLGK